MYVYEDESNDRAVIAMLDAMVRVNDHMIEELDRVNTFATRDKIDEINGQNAEMLNKRDHLVRKIAKLHRDYDDTH